jgi:hypothetical protein
MMDILQWGLNLLLIGGAAWFWLEQKKRTTNKVTSVSDERLDHLESRITKLEVELQKFQASFDEQLKQVEVLCEQANRALKNSRVGFGSFPLTQEESELKEAMYLTSEVDSIPSIAHLENTKIRLQKESSVDLKTLLKGQLA